jgi:hypothetical protein
MNIRHQLVLLFALCAGLSGLAADKPSLDSHLELLRPLLDKTWKGAFKDSTPDKPTVDVMRWERALNGNAVRVLHSINNGSYGGETIIRWDEKQQAVTYHYFTTAGFMTTGTFIFKDGKVVSHELVTGSANGVTEVRGTSRSQPDGTFHVKSEYLKNGEWVPGHEATYQEDPTTAVVFK